MPTPPTPTAMASMTVQKLMQALKSVSQIQTAIAFPTAMRSTLTAQALCLLIPMAIVSLIVWS